MTAELSFLRCRRSRQNRFPQRSSRRSVMTTMNGPRAKAPGPFAVSRRAVRVRWGRRAPGTVRSGGAGADPEPRPAGLFQTVAAPGRPDRVTVLEQPSPRRMLGDSPGRRNVVLSQSDELNERENDDNTTRCG